MNAKHILLVLDAKYDGNDPVVKEARRWIAVRYRELLTAVDSEDAARQAKEEWLENFLKKI